MNSMCGNESDPKLDQVAGVAIASEKDEISPELYEVVEVALESDKDMTDPAFDQVVQVVLESNKDEVSRVFDEDFPVALKSAEPVLSPQIAGVVEVALESEQAMTDPALDQVVEVVLESGKDDVSIFDEDFPAALKAEEHVLSPKITEVVEVALESDRDMTDLAFDQVDKLVLESGKDEVSRVLEEDFPVALKSEDHVLIPEIVEVPLDSEKNVTDIEYDQVVEVALESEKDMTGLDFEQVVEVTLDSEKDESDPEFEEDESDEVMISNEYLKKKIWLTYQEFKTPCAFAYSNIISAVPSPGLSLPSCGVLGLPLSIDDAKKIIAQSSQSPFGKRDKTVIDTSFRKCWELNSKQFSLENSDWNEAMEMILVSVKRGLGIAEGTGEISAELNKLLLYEPGAFFKPHKDTEKAPGMFGTLVVCLPSPHEGGKLVVTHDNETYEFETANSSKFSFSYAAWFADITHEVLPVTSGYRLMLTYNLIRKTDFEVPSYDLGRGEAHQLSTLLKRYNSRLENGDTELPPLLLFKLKHKYTEANLQLKLLKPRDFARVQILAKLSAKLGFSIYLANLELTVNTDDYYSGDEEKTQDLSHIVKLNGKLVKGSLDCPDGAFLDKPQDSREADREEHEGPTGNEGAPATYWYHDTVVALVPPSKKLDFLFEFNSPGDGKERLFFRLMRKFSADPTQKAKLVDLCRFALKQDPVKYNYLGESFQSFDPFFKRATVIALELGRIDLFQEACKKTDDKILLDNALMLGGWVASKGLDAMSDQLMQCVQILSSVAKKVQFLSLVAEGFEAAGEEHSSAEKLSLKQWSSEAILGAIVHQPTLTRADSTSLARFCTTMDWSLFESKGAPVILKAVTIVKITFINEFMSILPQSLVGIQQSFLETIIRNIWNQFDFDSTEFEWSESQVKGEILNEEDIRLIIQNSIKILTADCVKTAIIPSILSAIPKASNECTEKLFIPLVRMILKNQPDGFGVPDDQAIPPPLHKRLVLALLTKFLLETVDPEPPPPADWSRPTGSCHCPDCSVVNRFLKDPSRETLDFRCAQHRRDHLDSVFVRYGWKTDEGYDVTTIRSGSPYAWRITKHRRSYEKVKSQWMRKAETAIRILSDLRNDEPVKGRFEAYLQPYYSIIMSANVLKLPPLNSLVPTPQFLENDENIAHNHPMNQTGQKREASEMDIVEDGFVKRVK